MNAFNSSVPALSGDSPFTFPDTGQPVRTVEINGEPWFVAADVCAVLGIVNVGNALGRLDEGDKSSIRTADGTPGNPNRAIVNESGLYDLILDSRKPEARAFRRWVTSEVLPSIRKTGAYAAPKSELELARDYVRALEAKEELRAQIAELEPKASKWAEYMGTDGLIGMRELADMLGLDAKEMTRRLVELKVFRRLVSEDGGARNMPRRMYQNSGHFEVKIEQNGRKRYPVAYATTSGVEFVMHHLG